MVPFRFLVLDPTSEHNSLVHICKHFRDFMRPLQEADDKIAGPWSFWFGGLAGDLEWFRDVLLQIAGGHYYGCRTTICRECDASNTDALLNFRDFSCCSKHRETRKTSEEILANIPRNRWCPLYDVDGYSVELELKDIMHNLFQDGLMGSFGPSCIQILCSGNFYGQETEEDNLLICHDSAERHVLT